MSFDGVFTHNIVKELNQTLVRGRISKIQQPYENEVILTIRAGGKNHPLLLSVHPSYARIQVTTIPFQNPEVPPTFCMMLRKHLEGGILESIDQIANDRVIHFSFSKRDELGDLQELRLIVELMGRHSTIVLVNQVTNKILDTIKHIGPSQNSYRTLLPGHDYQTPPEPKGLNPFLTKEKEIFDILSQSSHLDRFYLQEHFQGLGRDTAHELAQRLVKQQNEKMKNWHDFWCEITNQPLPTLSIQPDKEIFSPIHYPSLGNEFLTFPTYSELLDYFYQGKAEKDRVRQQASDIIHRISNDFKKITGKIKKLQISLEDTENAELYRRKGELLTTYMSQVKKGADKVTLSNYYEDNQPLTILLNPALSSARNAQKYFQKYQKLKKAVQILKEQIKIAQQERHYLDSLLTELEFADPNELEILKEELTAAGYFKRKQKMKKTKKSHISQPETFHATDGTIILVGKNNLQNDQLTLKTGHKNQLWLHAKDIPGSHVVIRSEKPTETTILEAATLAAYYSKYRLSSSVPVDYTLLKYVHKPNGAKPGFVIYTHQKTLFVTPEKELIMALAETSKNKARKN